MTKTALFGTEKRFPQSIPEFPDPDFPQEVVQKDTVVGLQPPCVEADRHHPLPQNHRLHVRRQVGKLTLTALVGIVGGVVRSMVAVGYLGLASFMFAGIAVVLVSSQVLGLIALSGVIMFFALLLG